MSGARDQPRAAGQLAQEPAAGPTAARLLLGSQLRRLREAAGISRDDAGYAIRSSASKISRLELGRVSFKPRDLMDLLVLYGLTEPAEVATLTALAEQANRPSWWQPCREVVPEWLESYLGLEPAASLIRTYELQFIPGLLQTEEYARGVLSLSHGLDDTVLEQRVSLRLARQQILARRTPPCLWAVIDEAALRRPIGGAGAMRAQLRYLIEAAACAHITIQIVPFSAGGHAAAGGPVTLLRFPEGMLPDVVYLEHLTTAVYLTKPGETAWYWNVLNVLATESKPPAESIAILREILAET